MNWVWRRVAAQLEVDSKMTNWVSMTSPISDPDLISFETALDVLVYAIKSIYSYSYNGLVFVDTENGKKTFFL